MVDPHAKGNKAEDLDKQQNKEVDVVPALKLLLRIGRAVGVGVRFHKAKRAILIRPMKTLMTAWSSMPRTTPRKNMPSWVMDGRWKIEDGRWGKVDSSEQEASFAGDGHGEDHPNEQAADDVLEGFT